MSVDTVDPRALRFAAAITSLVLAVAIIAPSPWRETLLGLQAVVFALGAFGSLHRAPYGLLFARLVRPRLAPPTETEDARAPRFAQLVGLGFTATALVLLLAGLTVGGLVVAGLALVAALLNASIGLCLGCEVYLLYRRATAASPTT